MVRQKTTVKAADLPPTVAPMGPPTLEPGQVAKVLSVLRELYQQCDQNQSELARRLKMSQAAVRDLLEENNRPSFPTAEKIAKLAGINVWAMLGLPVPPVAPTEQSHPSLFSAIYLVGDRAGRDARERVVAAAAYLPDLALSTWMAMMLDAAHAPAPSSRSVPIPSSHPTPALREIPEKTAEVPIVPKKPA